MQIANSLEQRIERAFCPLCGNSASFICNTQDHDLGETFNWSRCHQCSHFFITDPPALENLAKYYQADQGQAMLKEPHWLLRWLQEIQYHFELGKVLKELPKGARIVDFGGGNGGLARYLVTKGFKVRVVDFGDIPSKDLSFEVVSGDLNQKDLISRFVTFNEGPADLIVLRHVLEHLWSPLDFFHEVRKSGAKKLFLIVPNVDSQFRKWYGAYWAYWDPPRHLHCFSPLSLKKLIEAAGAQLAEMTFAGADETIITIYRWLRLKKSKSTKSIEFLFGSKSPISVGMHALCYPFSKTVIRALVQLNR